MGSKWRLKAHLVEGLGGRLCFLRTGGQTNELSVGPKELSFPWPPFFVADLRGLLRIHINL